MSRLIEVDEIIKQAKKKGIDLGKGDPYNRLRYYTKIGFLPHMERKKNKKGQITGHYPADTLQKLEKIDQLKNEGLTNEQIFVEIQKDEKVNTIKDFITSPETRLKLAAYGGLALILLVMLVELNVLPIGQSKASLVENNTLPGDIQETQVLSSGRGIVPSNTRRVFVKSQNITSQSKVNVTFNSDYSPAARYWVEEIVPSRGFYLNMDAHVYSDATFNWWITN